MALAPLILAGLLGSLLVFVLWAAALATVSGQEAPVFTSSSEDGLPDIAANASRDYLALVWSRGRDQFAGPAGYVYLTTAPISQGEWKASVRVYPASATSSNAAREARVTFPTGSSTIAHMVWNQKTGSGFNQILYASCNVASPSSCAASAITAKTVATAGNGPNQPDIAVDDGGRRHVVWVNTDGQVLYSCSSDGTSWSGPITVVDAITATQPSIAFAGGKVHVVWAQGTGDTFNKIVYENASVSSACPTPASFGSGAAFDADAGGALDYQSRDPKVAAINNTVYVAWDVKTSLESGNVISYYLVYNRSTDGGSNWARSPSGPAPEYLDIPSAGTTLTERPVFNNRQAYNYNYGEWLHPGITLEVSGPNTIAHVVWQQSTLLDEDGNGSIDTGWFDIFYSSYNGSGTWAAPTNVTAGSQTVPNIYSVMPGVAVDQNGQVHMAYMREKGAYQDTPEDWDIYYFGLLKGPPQAEIFLPSVVKNSR
jgi:hypothetical protein